jgi:predicted MFS family arabinose efflux permease
MDARWLALLVLTIARVTMGFQFQSLGSIAPLLVRDLGVSYADIGFLIGLYMLPGIVLALPGGALGQRFGDKRMVLLGLLLMAAGGALPGIVPSYAGLVAGRALAGIGAVLLNVMMSKMVTDWFAGREIVLAMAVFANAFPIGIGVSLLCLGRLGESAGWTVALQATSIAAAAGLLLVAVGYRRHANDGRQGARKISLAQLSRREAVLVSVAGAIWGTFNGALGIMLGFVPILLVAQGLAVGQVGLLVGTATWLIVVSTQAGGIIAQRWHQSNALMLVGHGVAGAALLLLPIMAPQLPLVAFGLAMGLPIGVILSLPAAVLLPEHRGIGMGVFYTWMYIGHAALPPIAGWLQDRVGGAATSVYFAGALFLSIIPLFAAFRALRARTVQPVVARAG